MFDLYDSACDDRWRYVLGRSGTRPLFVIGLNPSTATREKADTTVAKVERVAYRHGYDGFLMLNLYPVRATDCRTLSGDPHPQAFQENLDWIEHLLAPARTPAVWAAWGSGILVHDYFRRAAHELDRRLARCTVTWLHFGPLTKAGHPRHPSRLSYAWRFAAFDYGGYLCGLDHEKGSGGQSAKPRSGLQSRRRGSQ